MGPGTEWTVNDMVQSNTSRATKRYSGRFEVVKNNDLDHLRGHHLIRSWRSFYFDCFLRWFICKFDVEWLMCWGVLLLPLSIFMLDHEWSEGGSRYSLNLLFKCHFSIHLITHLQSVHSSLVTCKSYPSTSKKSNNCWEFVRGCWETIKNVIFQWWVQWVELEDNHESWLFNLVVLEVINEKRTFWIAWHSIWIPFFKL